MTCHEKFKEFHVKSNFKNDKFYNVVIFLKTYLCDLNFHFYELWVIKDNYFYWNCAEIYAEIKY